MLTTSYQAATVFPRAHQDTGGGMDTHAHFVAPTSPNSSPTSGIASASYVTGAD